LRVRAASSCAKEESIAFTSTAKRENPLPCRVIEKFPREPFEAFAELLEFRRRSETFGAKLNRRIVQWLLQFKAEMPPLTEDASGALRIGNSRVLLEIVVRAFQDGATPESIVQRCSTLALPDVYAVLAYYLRHPNEVD